MIGTSLVAAPAVAEQSQDTVTCGGQELTIRANSDHSSDNGGWSSVQVVAGGSGHLTPVSFSGVLTDTTIDQVIFQFSQTKGGGHANHKQATVTCTEQFGGTLADFLEPGDELPPGTALTDDVTFDFTAVVVTKP
jgi:hypothetical protein